MLSKTFKILMALTLGVFISAIAVTQASASIVACTPSRCDYVGKSPVSAGCAADGYAVGNARLLAGSGGATGTVHLMYSPACNTNWTEADGYVFPTDIIVWNTIGQQQKTANLANYGGYGYTAMVNGAYDAGSCIANDRFWACFGQPAITSYPRYGSY